MVPGCSLSEAEVGLRKLSIKRTLPLDMVSSITDIGTDKYFFGYNVKKGLTFTRIKAALERLLPKLIIRLPSAADTAYYRIRLSAVSTLVFCMFTIPWLLSLLVTITGRNTLENFLFASGFYGIYGVLLLVELKLTMLRVSQAIKRYMPQIISPV